MELPNRLFAARQASGPRASRRLRVLAVAGLAGLSGSLFYSHAALQIGALPLWLLAGLVYSGAIGASAAVIFTLLPKLGQFVEFTAVSRLCLALVSARNPEVAATLITSPLLNATLVVGFAIVLRWIVVGPPSLPESARLRRLLRSAPAGRLRHA